MQSIRTKQLSALILSACLAGVTQQAQAQDPMPDPSLQEAPQTVPATQPGDDSAAPAATPPPTVPSYEPVDYELTAPGGSSSARSEIRRWPNRPLLGTSTLMLAASYAPAALYAKFNDDTSKNLYIPVAGPWMELAREPPVGAGSKALLVVSGVFQDLGALGMLTSLFVPERRTSSWFLVGNKRLSAAPVANRYTYGVSARGQF